MLRCIKAALLATLFVPILDNNAVIHVPILAPNNTGNADSILSRPAAASAIIIPVVADEL